MLEDVLLLNAYHHRAAGAIAEIIIKLAKAKFVVAISGESGSGKSEMGHAVGKALKKMTISSKILHIDNYYNTLPTERTRIRKEKGVESIGYNEYRWDKINEDIDAFRTDSKASLPCIDLITDRVDTLITDFSGISVLIIEGLYAIKAESDLKFFIDLTYHDTKKAQIVRGKEPENEFRLKILEQEHKVVQSLRDKVDYFITRDFLVLKNG